jgi:type III secretion protein T
MNPDAVLALIKNMESYVFGAALGLPRVTALFIVMPVFTRLGLIGILRSGIAVAMVLPLLPYLMATVPAGSMSFAELAPLLLKEAAVGAVIGLVLGVPIWAAEIAGEILDVQRGATFADMVDPLSSSNNNVTGTFLSVVVVALYFVSGGLIVTMRALYESYTLWPLQSFLPILRPESGDLLLRLLDDMMGMGLMLVVPIVISLLLSDLSLALIARAAPHMNIFILSLTVKNLTFTLFLVLYGAFLMTYMRSDLATILDFSSKLQQFAPQ